MSGGTLDSLDACHHSDAGQILITTDAPLSFALVMQRRSGKAESDERSLFVFIFGALCRGSSGISLHSLQIFKIDGEHRHLIASCHLVTSRVNSNPHNIMITGFP